MTTVKDLKKDQFFAIRDRGGTCVGHFIRIDNGGPPGSQRIVYLPRRGPWRIRRVRPDATIVTEGVTWAWGNSLAENLLRDAIAASRSRALADAKYRPSGPSRGRLIAGQHSRETQNTINFVIRHLNEVFGGEARPGVDWAMAIIQADLATRSNERTPA